MDENLKVELIKKTIAIHGTVYYFVKVNGYTESDSWTTDPLIAEEKFAEICAKAKQFPKDVYETLKTFQP
jgi:hypothetical protein